MLLLVLIICSLHDCESLREVYFCRKIIYCWQKDEGIATHSSTLPWKIPWMEKLGGLHSMGSLRVGHDWATSLSLFTFMHGEGNGNPLQCSAWWAAVYGVTQSRTWLRWLGNRWFIFKRFQSLLINSLYYETYKINNSISLPNILIYRYGYVLHTLAWEFSRIIRTLIFIQSKASEQHVALVIQWSITKISADW